METKLIFKPKLARELLKKGNSIVDIKANKSNSDMTVFVFELTDKFIKDLQELVL